VIFDDAFQEQLEGMYRQTGAGDAPNPPAMLCILLQGYVGASDAEAVELAVMNLRLVPDARAPVRQALGRVEEHRLGGPGDLVPQLRVTNARRAREWLTAFDGSRERCRNRCRSWQRSTVALSAWCRPR